MIKKKLALEKKIGTMHNIIFWGRLAQLVRASVLHTGCRRFESCIAHHLEKTRTMLNSSRFFVYKSPSRTRTQFDDKRENPKNRNIYKKSSLSLKNSELKNLADDEGRTRNIQLGKLTLCQLSYVRNKIKMQI